jgi:hypothetical protein
MEDKDRFDALMKLAEFRRQVRQSRRETEWRVTMAAWGLVVVSAVSLKSNPVLYSAFASLMCLMHFLWVRWNFRTSERDIRIAFEYVDAASKILFPDRPPPGREHPKGVFDHWPTWTQVMVTIGLALCGLGFQLLATQIRPLPFSN